MQQQLVYLPQVIHTYS